MVYSRVARRLPCEKSERSMYKKKNKTRKKKNKSKRSDINETVRKGRRKIESKYIAYNSMPFRIFKLSK